MLAYMLDTDICVYLIKNHPPHLRERFDSFTGQICISTITMGELLFGAEKSARRAQNIEAVEAFVARVEILSFSPKAAGHFGQLRAELTRVGRPAGPFDTLIGAHARSEGLILVTNNMREFARMPGLQVENWAA
jgi:tRNA(fMet)-specific endonuclease VapC